MHFILILAAALLAPVSRNGSMGRDVAGRVSLDLVQAAAPEPSTQQPRADAAPAKGSEASQTETKSEETPPAKKVDEAGSPKPPATPPTSGARKRRVRAKKSSPPTAQGEPRKVVIHQGGSSEPVAQILPGITLEEASRQRESAEQLLNAAEFSVKQLAERSLSKNQQETLVQIRQYMDGARSALDSDTQRAHTLALKAYLLSDDLVKREK